MVDEYIDDGWSGTNFDRPNFQRMMADVDAGKINCIITKDLSRFGREHVMMDYYLEFVFPEKKIRYIAVTENEDTEKGLCDFVPFKNLFNEWFAKDTGRKVKTALHAKHAAGERIFTYAPLGYKQHPEIKNAMIIDEETRWIIEKIFDLAVHGSGAGRITRILITEKVPTPAWIHYQRSGKFAHIFADAPEEKRYLWTISQVKHILKDETYIGNSVHNRQSTISYKNQKKVRKPKEEWFIVENTHQPIISKDVFFQVQNQIEDRRRQLKDGKVQIFSGLVKCSDCGWSLRYGTHSGKNKFGYYTCSRYGQGTKQCISHYVRYDVLYLYVLSRIQYWSKQADLDEEKLLQRILKAGDKEQQALIKRQTVELGRAEKRKQELDKLFGRLYEDWVSGRITEYNFNMLYEKYQTEQKELIGKIDKLQQQMVHQKQTVTDAQKWISLVKQFTYPTELTAELLNALIEKIVVHHAVKNEDGSKDQEIEIYYRFIGKID